MLILIAFILPGLSMGGFGTWDLASYSPERFAAIAPDLRWAETPRKLFIRLVNKIPAWVFHGAKDSVVPLVRSTELVDGFKKRGVDVKFTVYPEAGHDSWSKTYDNPELYTNGCCPTRIK